MQKRTMSTPDETITVPKGVVQKISVEGMTIARITAQPGWRWSESVKPLANTPSCEAPHTQYHVSGRLRVRMDDGTEMEFGPGDVSVIPPGHDAWVVGSEPVVVIDITGGTAFGKKAQPSSRRRSILGAPVSFLYGDAGLWITTTIFR